MKSYDERARECFGHGCNTYSKRSDQFVKGVYPTHCYGSDGHQIFGTDGNKYVDFCSGLGANINGVRNIFTLPTATEVEVAELIKKRIPCIERLRFLKTGSEACESAVKLARAFNGRQWVFGCGYHGHLNTFINAEKPGLGTYESFYFKHSSIKQIVSRLENMADDVYIRDVSAVIVEPVMLEDDQENDKVLRRLKKICNEHEIILIFDEVITGFRVKGTAISNRITPDIVLLGKALGNGHPLAVVGGRKDIFDKEGYFISSTFSGEVTSLLEAKATIEFMSESVLSDLVDKGLWFMNAVNTFDSRVQLKGYGSRGEWKGDNEDLAKFWQEMIKRGWLFGRAFFLRVDHTKDELRAMLCDCEEILTRLEDIELEGEAPQPVFKRN